MDAPGVTHVVGMVVEYHDVKRTAVRQPLDQQQTGVVEVATTREDRTGIAREEIFAAGDHFNDLPMLLNEHACWLVAPANAIPPVKEAVWREGGYVSDRLWGHGVADGLEAAMKEAGLL